VAASDEVLMGDDGKPRCHWAGETTSHLTLYHDKVWGKRTYREPALFEALTLGVVEVGVSWRVVFGKREAFIRAFQDFNVSKVAGMTNRDVDRLLQDPSIIRNRGKIEATIDNARTMRCASPSLAALARSYAADRLRSPRSAADVPTTTPRPRRSRKS
jgi:DNA-3-methyladenine glycosylase I